MNTILLGKILGYSTNIIIDFGSDKLFLNSLYGKFGMNIKSTKIEVLDLNQFRNWLR